MTSSTEDPGVGFPPFPVSFFPVPFSFPGVTSPNKPPAQALTQALFSEATEAKTVISQEMALF